MLWSSGSLHRLVVFVFVRIGFEGLDSKGPQRLSDLEMVTMWSWPVPPTSKSVHVPEMCPISNQIDGVPSATRR